ncbi:hypothetical protein OROGR_016869 [Orobanche gracilis]
MALVSATWSLLNSNAPLFVPAAMRRVEDFSPEWWDLVTTSASFRDYWISQHQGEDVFGEDGFDDSSVVGLLLDSIDLDVDDDILNMEIQFEEFLQSAEADHGKKPFGGATENGFGKSPGALVKSVNMQMQRGLKSPMEPVKWFEKPAKHVIPKHSPHSIQQPR